MITIQRTTRDAWWLFLPIIIFFVGIMTYVSLAAHGFVPVFGTIYADASWLAPPISVLLWYILACYVYRLFFPVIYTTEIRDDRVILRTSSRPQKDHVLLRRDIQRFYVKPIGGWHNSDSPCPILYDTMWLSLPKKVEPDVLECCQSFVRMKPTSQVTYLLQNWSDQRHMTYVNVHREDIPFPKEAIAVLTYCVQDQRVLTVSVK